MKKVLFFIFILFLSFSSVSLLKPQAAEAAEGGPAGKLMLRGVSGPKAGEVTLFWNDVQAVDNFHLVYGTDSKDMKYGVLNIGKNKVYTVKMLTPGAKYYFALVPVRNNIALYTSEWISAVAAGGEVSKPAVETAAAPITPVAKITPVVPLVWAGSSGPVDKLGLWAKAGPNEGEATLYWKNVDDANNYHLVYGTEVGKYRYGALNIGWTTSYTVKKLVPGVTYYFALVPVKGNRALYTTNSVAVIAKVNAEIVTTTREAVMQPLSTIIPPGLTGTQATSPSYPPYTSGQ